MMNRDGVLFVDGERFREEAWYRYSVRCDRGRNAAITKAAAKAGLTVNAFVQRHFDRILEADLAEPAKASDISQPELQGFAQRHGVTVGHARVWFLLKGLRGCDGVARMSIPEIGEACFITPDTCRTYIGVLSGRGLLERVGGHGKACFRVSEGA